MQTLAYMVQAALALLGVLAALVAVLYLNGWARAPFEAKRIFARIDEHFAPFVQSGDMCCVERRYWWNAFGNVTVRYEGSTYFLHVYRDRLDWGFIFGCRGARAVEYEAAVLLPFLNIGQDSELRGRERYEPGVIGDLASAHAATILAYLKEAAANSSPLDVLVT